MSLGANKMMNKMAKSSSLLKELTEEETSQLKSTLLFMLTDINSAAESLGIKTMVGYGTALGAYRHQDIIPWDDDVDILMFRDDWELFKSSFDRLLSEKYYLEAPNYGDNDSKMPWGKIYLKNTLLEEIQDVNAPYCKGIFIDVFIFDGVSDNRIVRMIDGFVTRFMCVVANSMIFYKYPNDLMKEFSRTSLQYRIYFIFRKALGCLFSLFGHKTWCNWFDKFAARHGCNREYITIPTANYEKDMFLKSQIVPLSTLKLRDLHVNAPGEIENYLTRHYGKNYMQLPPVEKRERHFVINIKFQGNKDEQ